MGDGGDDGDTPGAVLAEHKGQPGLVKSEWVPIAGRFLPGEVIEVSLDMLTELSHTPSPVFYLTPPLQQAPLVVTAAILAVTLSMPDSGVVPSTSAVSMGTILEHAPVSTPAAASAVLLPLLAALGLTMLQKSMQSMPSLPMMQAPPSFAARALDLAPGSTSDAPVMHTSHLTNLDLASQAGLVQ